MSIWQNRGIFSFIALALTLAGCTHPSGSNAVDTAENIATLPITAPFYLYFHQSPIVDKAPFRRTWGVGLSPDGSHVAAVDYGRLFVYDITSKRWSDMRLPGDGGVAQYAFSPRASEIAVLTPCATQCGHNGRAVKIVIADLSTAHKQREFLLPANVTGLGIFYSPDGKRLAVEVACTDNCGPSSKGSRIAMLNLDTNIEGGVSVPAALRYPLEANDLPSNAEQVDRFDPRFRADGMALLYNVYEMFGRTGGTRPAGVLRLAILDLADPKNPREHLLPGEYSTIVRPMGFTRNGDALFSDLSRPPVHRYDIARAGMLAAARDDDAFNQPHTGLPVCAASCDLSAFLSLDANPQLFLRDHGVVRQVTHFSAPPKDLRLVALSANARMALISIDNSPFVIDIATGNTTAVPVADLDGKGR